MAKKKQILHLHEGEVAVVFPVDVWKHIISTYEVHADDAQSHEDSLAWLGIASDVRQAIEGVEVNEWND